MKKIFSILSLMVGLAVFGQKIPTVSKTEFTQKALQDKVVNTERSSLTLENVINQYKGNIVVLDLWATWCGDCITAIPKLKELKAANPDVKFVYLSMDKTEEAWKKGIEKYQIEGDHYYMGNNWKNDFATSIDLNWIPRYLVLDQEGNIAKYYSVKAEDPEVQNTINKLRLK
ncbi:TlpA family protein disulfide reductase [Faecalibacter bovis]|uniref:Redoxin family protein n=1 Tax=Faecalibacter bovis TaxID=2898187 RepID=A0ABX7XG58_9FLAO|nr:thioredoxin family protein [Faecalibacter bovis]QTV06933.1 redoxin family protein [Faecalibacter bovis]